MIAHFDKIVFNSNRVLNAAKIMEMPVMATEQYPKGLGKTVPEIELAKFEIVPFEKTCFTMAIPEVGGSDTTHHLGAVMNHHSKMPCT